MTTDLRALAGAIVLPDESILKQVQDLLDARQDPLGRLGPLVVWLAAAQGRCPPQPPAAVRLLVVDGGSSGTTVVPPLLLEQADARLRVIGPYEPEAGTEAFDAGLAAADTEIDGGADLLAVAGHGAGIPTAAVVALLTGTDVASVVGRGPGVDDREWMRRCAAIRDLARRARPVTGELAEMLSFTHAAAVAAAAGVIVQAAARRTPVILDGDVAAAAALVAQRVSYRAVRWLSAAQRTGDPGQSAALRRLRLDPLLDYGLHNDIVAAGALLMLPHLRAAIALLDPEGT